MSFTKYKHAFMNDTLAKNEWAFTLKINIFFFKGHIGQYLKKLMTREREKKERF